jgi:hypothetical protein
MKPGFSTKGRGRARPAVDTEAVNLRMRTSDLAALDAYVGERGFSRQEMIRRIVQDRLIHEGVLEPRPELGVEDPTRGKADG